MGKMKDSERPGIVFMNWYVIVTGILAALIFLWVAPSCDRDEEFQGFLMSDGIVKGCGFLLGVNEGGRTNVLFVTCRHVIEERMERSKRNFLDGPFDGNAIFLNMHGAGFRYRKIANIEPSRWRFSKNSADDIAWLELTEAECELFAGVGRMPVLAMLGERNDGLRAVGRVSTFFHLGAEKGSEVKVIKVAAITDVLAPFSGVIPLPVLDLALAVAYESTGEIREINFSDKVIMSDRSVKWMRGMHSLSCSSHKNNSGSPILYGKSIIGLLVATQGSESAFQCLDPILEYYGIDN